MAFTMDVSPTTNIEALANAMAQSEAYFDSQRATNPEWNLGTTLLSFTEVPGSPNVWLATYQTQIQFSSASNPLTGELVFTPMAM